MSARLSLAVLWLLHWLPLRALAWLGDGLGWLTYRLARDRRQVTLLNLRRCFPHWNEAKYRAVALRHFREFAASILGLGLAWFAPLSRMRRLVRIEGREHLDEALAQGPVIVLAPHFFGLDITGILLAADYNVVSLYGRSKNLEFDELVKQRRLRWGRGKVYSRQDGVLKVVRALKPGWVLYYHPDQDFGARDSIFVDFFGIPTATTPGTTRLARLAHARLVPSVVRQDFRHGGFNFQFYPAWKNFPSGDETADTRRINAFIEARALEQPACYLWSHKRFKTRPPGEPPFYD